MHRRIASLALLCLLIEGCRLPDDGGEFLQVDSAGVTITTSRAPAAVWTLEAEPELSIGTVDGGPTEFFRLRDVAVLPGARIAVVNGGTEEIRFFSIDGEYLGSTGRSGRGPGEFISLWWLASVGDSLLTHDWGNDRISVFSVTGRYARSFRLEWHYGILSPVAALPDRRLLAFTARHMVDMPHAGVVTDSALLSVYDSSGALLDSIGRFAHNQRFVRRQGNLQTTMTVPFSGRGQVVPAQDGFCHVFGIYHEIRCFDIRGKLLRITRLTRAREPVTEADIEAHWRSELASDNERYVRSLQRLRDVLPFPEYFPAHIDLKTDDRNRLWALKYRRSDEPEDEWRVVEDGRWVASVMMDTAFQLKVIRGNRVFGIWRDDLGVESVRIYRLKAQVKSP